MEEIELDSFDADFPLRPDSDDHISDLDTWSETSSSDNSNDDDDAPLPSFAPPTERKRPRTSEASTEGPATTTSAESPTKRRRVFAAASLEAPALPSPGGPLSPFPRGPKRPRPDPSATLASIGAIGTATPSRSKRRTSLTPTKAVQASPTHRKSNRTVFRAPSPSPPLEEVAEPPLKRTRKSSPVRGGKRAAGVLPADPVPGTGAKRLRKDPGPDVDSVHRPLPHGSPSKRATAHRRAKAERRGSSGIKGFVVGDVAVTPYQQALKIAEAKREEGNAAYAAGQYDVCPKQIKYGPSLTALLQRAIALYTEALPLYPPPLPPATGVVAGYTSTLANRSAAYMGQSDYPTALHDISLSLSLTVLPPILPALQKAVLAKRTLRLVRCHLALGQATSALRALEALSPPSGAVAVLPNDPLVPQVDQVRSQVQRLAACVSEVEKAREGERWEEVVRWVEVLRKEGPRWGVKPQKSEPEGGLKPEWQFWKGEALAWLGNLEEAESTVR